MRIIAGTARGRTIAAPPAGTRPTSDRVRESLFGILEARVGLDGTAVLDLYAGSGALGLESVSRGAAHATFVESSARAASTIAANIAACGLRGSTVEVVRRPVAAVLAGEGVRRFDIVVLDPPYDLDDGAVRADLTRLADGGWLSTDAVVVVERSARSGPTQWPTGLQALMSRRYGDTRLDLAVSV